MNILTTKIEVAILMEKTAITCGIVSIIEIQKSRDTTTVRIMLDIKNYVTATVATGIGLGETMNGGETKRKTFLGTAEKREILWFNTAMVDAALMYLPTELHVNIIVEETALKIVDTKVKVEMESRRMIQRTVAKKRVMMDMKRRVIMGMERVMNRSL